MFGSAKLPDTPDSCKSLLPQPGANQIVTKNTLCFARAVVSTLTIASRVCRFRRLLERSTI